MTLGASALGQSALGGGGFEAGTNFVDVAASIAITTGITCAIAVTQMGFVDIAAAVSSTSTIQASLTISGAVYGDVQLAAAIAMQSSFTAEMSAAPAMPDAGVRFTLSDRAGGV